MSTFSSARPLLILVVLQILIAVIELLTRLVVAENAARLFYDVPLLLQACAFTAAGLYLLAGGRRDTRAVSLGITFLLVAATFRQPNSWGLEASPLAAGMDLVQALIRLDTEAFLPAFFWHFAARFPHLPDSPRARRSWRRFLATLWAASAVLFAASVPPALGVWPAIETPQAPAEHILAWLFQVPGKHLFILALMLPAFAALVVQARRAQDEERQRGRLFLGALLLAAPLILDLLVEAAVPAYERFLYSNPRIILARYLVDHAILLVIPFATAYAVRVHRVLDIRGIAHRMVQHTLARGTARALILAPFALLVVDLIRHRDETLTTIVSSRRLLLLATIAFGLIGLRYRDAILGAIDRRFFDLHQDDSPSLAGECLRCGRLYSPEIVRCAACHQILEEAIVPHKLPGKLRFEQRLGSGSMAVVFRATDLILGRPVAVKTLPRVSPKAVVRLRREARAAARVVHPGLAAIYGLESWRGTPLLVLELLAGGTLGERLLASPLTPRETLATGQTVAQALEQLHAIGILHRDIKPSNIGYTRAGQAKLLDFGIARVAPDLCTDGRTDDEETTADSTAALESVDSVRKLGTIAYLPPEAFEGLQPDPAFDLWGLSVVLYEALSGVNLFTGNDLQDLTAHIRQARVPDIRQHASSCPAPLASFFHDALHRDRRRRPQSAAELHRRLAEIELLLAL